MPVYYYTYVLYNLRNLVLYLTIRSRLRYSIEIQAWKFTKNICFCFKEVTEKNKSTLSSNYRIEGLSHCWYHVLQLWSERLYMELMNADSVKIKFSLVLLKSLLVLSCCKVGHLASIKLNSLMHFAVAILRSSFNLFLADILILWKVSALHSIADAHESGHICSGKALHLRVPGETSRLPFLCLAEII